MSCPLQRSLLPETVVDLLSRQEAAEQSESEDDEEDGKNKELAASLAFGNRRF